MERVEARFRETSRFWKQWIAKSKYKGRWRETVNRSALMLKLLTSQEHGSLIAALAGTIVGVAGSHGICTVPFAVQVTDQIASLPRFLARLAGSPLSPGVDA